LIFRQRRFERRCSFLPPRRDAGPPSWWPAAKLIENLLERNVAVEIVAPVALDPTQSLAFDEATKPPDEICPLFAL